MQGGGPGGDDVDLALLLLDRSLRRAAKPALVHRHVDDGLHGTEHALPVVTFERDQEVEDLDCG